MYYYASKISPNMAVTPEGFLLCKNVPIARTGKQVYLAGELPLRHKDPNEQVEVFRDEGDVFSQASMASFEGKPVVDEHPDADQVTPQNARDHIEGVSTNIRRGQGSDADKLLADLLIYDAMLIEQIQNGKREVSCGYGCDFAISEDGRIFQKNIVGNHVAVVSAGRAGSRVAIKDGSPETEVQSIGEQTPRYERRSKRMGNTRKKKPSERSFAAVLTNIFPLFAKDAAPDDITEAVEDLIEAIEEEVAVEPAVDKVDEAPVVEKEAKKDEVPAKDEEPPEWAKMLLREIKDCKDRLDSIEDARKDGDPLEKLEEELSGEGGSDEPEDVEAELIEPAEEIEAEDEATDTEEVADEAGFVMPASGRPKTMLNKDAALKEIRKMKPIIAQIPDEKKRKAMSDSLAKLIRSTYGLPTKENTRTKSNNYAAILETQRRNAKKRTTQDNAAPEGRSEKDIVGLGERISRSKNPHNPNFKKKD